MVQLMILWVSWCLLHSLLITVAVRRWMEHRGGRWLGLYRIGYVLFAVGSLLPLVWYTAHLPQRPFGPIPVWLRGVQGLLLLYSLVLFIGGLRVYDLQTFLGLSQWRDYRAGRLSTVSPFRRSGILRFVRHPWYSGGIALLWGLPGLTDVTLVTRSILSAYLILGTLLEERKLRASLGEPYRMYCREVPMLIPWKFWR
jgi:protein-S-isoprenylcysteine O-methyltransferase Ste14